MGEKNEAFDPTSVDVRFLTDDTGPKGALDRMNQLFEVTQFDAPLELFEEGLSLARQGLLGAARDRLRMLLCLNPDDGDAHLLLAKVYIAQQEWSQALDQLDKTRRANVEFPARLQTEVETNLANQHTTEAGSQLQKSIAARENVELASLRSNVRELRSNLEEIKGERTILRRRLKLWFFFAGGLTAVSLAKGVELYMGEDRDSIPTQETSISEPVSEPTNNPPVISEPSSQTEGGSWSESFSQLLEKLKFRSREEEATSETSPEKQPVVKPSPSKGASSKKSPEVLRERQKNK
ncbi:MAG: tetratricopeptide repeat protein [Candidatus Gracilibacteria bacterium]|jgi:tetratricopeptide (TPR) repeat protein